MDTTKGIRVNTQFRKQSNLGKPHSSSRSKLYSVTPLPKSMVFLKVGESNALSKPVTSNSAPSSHESTVMNNERLIASGIFRIYPFKASRGLKKDLLHLSLVHIDLALGGHQLEDFFILKGKTIATSESVCQSDCSKGDNACTSNPQELISRWFPNSTFYMTRGQNWFDTLLIPLLSEYKPKDKKKIMEIMNVTLDELLAMAYVHFSA
ncbi:hypothetical protein Tco_1103698 [Tanacetum coccineum]